MIYNILLATPYHTRFKTAWLYCVSTPKTSLVSNLSRISAETPWYGELNFTELFAKAWLQALTPANIVAGFRSCGIYPFNRNAISFPDDGDSGSSGTIPRNASSHIATDGDHSVVARTVNLSTSTFTSMQIELFQIRFEEGYTIYNDKDYVSWLELNHPEAAPSNLDTATSSLTVSLLCHMPHLFCFQINLSLTQSHMQFLSLWCWLKPYEWPASTSITVSPANLSSPLSAVSPTSCVGSSPTSGSPVPPAMSLLYVTFLLSLCCHACPNCAVDACMPK